MKNILLGNGAEMPVIGFGTYKNIDPEQCRNSVAEAIKIGYRLIDTAAVYDNEEYVGEGIRASGIARKDIFITSKLWFYSYETDAAEKAVRQSLEKLNVDYLDMMLLHWPFGNTYAAWRVLEKFYEQGKIRAIGVSNFDMSRMLDLLSFNKIKPAVNQIETHLYCQRKTERKWMQKYGVAAQAYSPLGQGRANEMFEEDAVKRIAAAHGKTPAQIALAFLMQSGIAVIPKSARVERIKENFEAASIVLTGDEMDALAAIDTAKAMIGTAETPEKVEVAMTWKNR